MVASIFPMFPPLSRRSVVRSVLLFLVGTAPLMATERIFVLVNADQIRQFEMNNKGVIAPGATYTAKELPSAFPAGSIEVKSGNIVQVYDAHGQPKARLVFDAKARALKLYDGNAGDVASTAGRIIEVPDDKEIFRASSPLYMAKKSSQYRAALLREQFRQASGRTYSDIFVIDGQVFGTTGDRIDRLSAKDGVAIAGKPEAALQLAGSKLGRATVSPWGEAFIADAGTSKVQRVVLSGGALVSNGTVGAASIPSPGGLAFSANGDLYIASGAGVQRYQFVLENFVDWRAVAAGSPDLGGAGALDVALARPIGFVLSETVQPLEKLSAAVAGGHHGISQTIFIDPSINTESATIALVQYEPGGYTIAHLHPQMEQVEIVISGRAVWEVGEIEREVGPGDVIYAPRFVKHGYRVLGNQPFKFYQIEWREWAIRK
jgi:quercetin dioxygenase-like cupin family protein